MYIKQISTFTTPKNTSVKTNLLNFLLGLMMVNLHFSYSIAVEQSINIENYCQVCISLIIYLLINIPVEQHGF